MAAEGHSSIDALSQFKLAPVFGHLGETLHFSNANVMMLAASVLTLLLMWVGMSPRAMIPGRLQSAAEMAYETVMTLCIEQIGHEGKTPGDGQRRAARLGAEPPPTPRPSVRRPGSHARC